MRDRERELVLLSELGVRYLLDWPNDERPYSISSLISIPVSLELDDVYAMSNRRLMPWIWESMVIDAFDQLYEESSPESPRLLVLNLHPWFCGHPFRVASVARILAHVRTRSQVWTATTGEVAQWYRTHGDPTGAQT